MAFRQLHDMAGNEVWVNTSYILWMQRSGNATTVHFAVLGGNNGRPFSQQYREIPAEIADVPEVRPVPTAIIG